MTRILITGVVGCALSWALGHFLLPVLHALKAGASIREIGPTWHNNKTGTPIMGGLMFIFAAILCLLGNLPSMTDYSVFFVLVLALCTGVFLFGSPEPVGLTSRVLLAQSLTGRLLAGLFGM